MIEDLLKQLGFNRKETAVYLTILKQGKITPAQIAKITAIKRPTVYSTIKELLEKGVIIEDIADKQSSFLALPPQDLENLIRQDERRIKDKKKVIAKAIEELGVFTKNTHYSVPKIQFVYEENLNDYLYKQYKNWKEDGERLDNTWWGYHDHSFTEKYPAWIEWIWAQDTQNKGELKVRFLTNEAGALGIEKEMQIKHPERKMTFLKDSKFDTCLWVVGDYIIMVQTREKPNYLVDIHDPVLARNQRELFKKIWRDTTGTDI